MKKILYGMAALTFCLMTIMPASKTIAAGPPDQQCDASLGGYTTMVRDSQNILSQTFTPAQNRLSRVKLYVKGDGVGQLAMAILHGNALYSLSTNGMVDEPSGSASVDFYFNDIVLIPGDSTYKIMPIYNIGNDTIFWYKKTACYAGGDGMMGAAIQTYDFDFATYGFDYIDPGPPPSNDGTQQETTEPVVTPATSTTTTTTTPTTKTASVTLKAPTELKASDKQNDEGGAILLQWKASTTTTVDGYQIYRSESEKGTYTAIASVKKEILTYTDDKASLGKTYYYTVRSYDDTLESANSNIVNAKSIDNTAPATPVNFKFVGSTTDTIKLAWDANTEKDLAGYYLIVTKSKSESIPLKLIDIEKNASSYQLKKTDLKLKSDMDLNFYLQAKDDSGNFSGKAGAIKASFVQKAAAIADDVAETTWVDYTVPPLMVVLLAIVLGYLIMHRKKHFKEKHHTKLADVKD